MAAPVAASSPVEARETTSFLVSDSPSTIYGGGSGDQLYSEGSSGSVITAASGNETLSGVFSYGNDSFKAGSGSDEIDLGTGKDTVVAGTGQDTVNAGSSADLFRFVDLANTAGGTTIIDGFKLGIDKLQLQGYGANAVTNAVANAQVVNGSTVVTLPDSTKITLTDLTGVTKATFT